MCSMMTNHSKSWLLLFCHFVMLLYHLRQWTMDSVWSTKCLRCPWSMILLILMLLQFNLLILGSVRFIAFSLWCHHSPQTKAGTVWCVGVICGDARFINHVISSNDETYFHHANLINHVFLTNDQTYVHHHTNRPQCWNENCPFCWKRTTRGSAKVFLQLPGSNDKNHWLQLLNWGIATSPDWIISVFLDSSDSYFQVDIFGFWG